MKPGTHRGWPTSLLMVNTTVAPPQAPEVFTNGALLASGTDKLIFPWRILAIGDLPRIMHSTLGTDLAAPAIELKNDFVKPGHASWSWAILKDEYTTFDVQKKFIDYAADYNLSVNFHGSTLPRGWLWC